MTDFSDLCSQIGEWANRQDWTPALVTSFVRMAESKFNQEMRVDRMIESDDGLVASCCAPLPDDWLAMDLVQVQSANPNYGFVPIRYKARDEFFSLPVDKTCNAYTLEGRQIFFGGPPDAVNGVVYRISYYGEVPVLSDAQQSWIYTKHPQLYLFASLMHADLHAVGEEDAAGAMKQLVEDQITKLNMAHLAAKASGSRVTRTRTRSFG